LKPLDCKYLWSAEFSAEHLTGEPTGQQSWLGQISGLFLCGVGWRSPNSTQVMAAHNWAIAVRCCIARRKFSSMKLAKPATSDDPGSQH